MGRYTKGMQKLGVNFAIFVLFFGIAALEALRTQNWLMVGFWFLVGAFFLWADLKKPRV